MKINRRSRLRAGIALGSALPLLVMAIATSEAAVADDGPDSRNTSTESTTGAAPASTDWVTITNGTVMLGVWDTGELNVPAAMEQPELPGATGVVGLRFVPTGYESTADGCLCEGWGVADFTTKVTGSANQDWSGSTSNMTVESFTTTADSAVSVVRISDDTDTDVMRVTHNYHPSATPNLYAVDVAIENLSAAPIDPRYRRVMDWDIQPTAFAEWVTIQGTAAADNVLFASDDGFASADPLAGPSDIGLTGDFVDQGPADHGSLFDFGFDPVAPGGDFAFTTYYGAAATEAGADAALATVGAEVYSYGQPDTPTGPTNGDPNTFIFAFSGVGGAPVFPAVAFVSPVFSVSESAGNASITVKLSTPAETPVTVDYATADGTATAGEDYTVTSGTLTFPAGSTGQTFSVPLLDNALVEADETVNLSLTNPTAGAFLGTPSEAVLTIVDDDDDEPGKVVERISGSDRYGTAAAISSTWSPGVDTVYLASGLNYPDAMPAGALGGTHDAPVLLTRTTSLPNATKAELTRLAPQNIVVLGGDAAISNTLIDDLQGYAQADTPEEVSRIAGPDRYATAAQAAMTYPAGVQVAYIAKGTDFPDALSAAARGGALDSPVLLTRTDSLPASTIAALTHLNADKIIVLGGTAAVSDAIMTELDTYTTGTVTRLAGTNRYDTAAMVSQDYAPGVNAVFVATGEVYPDSMSGAPISVSIEGPIVLTKLNTLPPETITELQRLDPERIIIFGGTNAVSAQLQTDLAAYFG